MFFEMFFFSNAVTDPQTVDHNVCTLLYCHVTCRILTIWDQTFDQPLKSENAQTILLKTTAKNITNK